MERHRSSARARRRRGVVSRFGTLNPTDGGESSRASLSFNRVQRTDTGLLQFSAYAIRYKLDLWSTFTYYLKDPVNGDQMLQRDDRVVYGVKGSKTWYGTFWVRRMSNIVGVQARIDDIQDVGIFSTYRRRIIGTTQNAGVTESNAALYAENSIQWTRMAAHHLGRAQGSVRFRRQRQDVEQRRQLQHRQRPGRLRDRRQARLHIQSETRNRARAPGPRPHFSSTPARAITATMPAA